MIYEKCMSCGEPIGKTAYPFPRVIRCRSCGKLHVFRHARYGLNIKVWSRDLRMVMDLHSVDAGVRF